MSSWRECKLGDICTDISYGYTASAKSENVGPKFLRITDIVPDRITWGNVPFCEIDDKKKEQYKLEVGDIVIARTGATTGYNKVIKDDIDSVFASYLIRYKIDKQQAFPAFIGYSLQSYEWKGFVEGIIGGSAQPGANAKQFASYDILLPSLEEQKAIAEVLSSLDDKIDLLHRQNQILESLAQTLFRQWFIEEAKEEWEEKPLGKITNIAIGRTPPRKEDEWFSTDFKDVKWISIKDLGNDGVFIFKTSEYLTQEAIERFNVPVIPKDTVVLSFKMTVGRVAITTETMLSNEAIAHFKFHDKTPISKEYLYLFLKTFPYDSLGSTSSIVTAINSAMIKEMMILIPDEKTIKDFSSIVEPQFEKIRQNQKQIQTLENLRDTLLPKLLSGEVRVESSR